MVLEYIHEPLEHSGGERKSKTTNINSKYGLFSLTNLQECLSLNSSAFSQKLEKLTDSFITFDSTANTFNVIKKRIIPNVYFKFDP